VVRSNLDSCALLQLFFHRQCYTEEFEHCNFRVELINNNLGMLQIGIKEFS
jgi:hypothetical protein